VCFNNITALTFSPSLFFKQADKISLALPYFPLLIYISSIVHLSHINHLLPSSNGNRLGVDLVHQSVVGGLDGVHGVLGPGHAGGDVVDAGGAAHFEDAVGAAETKAYVSLY
jgi:hypothetical protein